MLRRTSEILQDFPNFVTQHTQQWQNENKPGHFGAWPAALRFNEALVTTQCFNERVRLINIIADNQIIARQYTFAFGDTWFWELPSRMVGVKWEKFSLGPTGIVVMIDYAIKEGIRFLEGGIGRYDYKVRLGAKELNLWKYHFSKIARRTQARIHCLNCWKWMIGKGYHKLWYRRIAPRLPKLFWKPQWRSWCRLYY